jgi:hypothetical protein
MFRTALGAAALALWAGLLFLLVVVVVTLTTTAYAQRWPVWKSDPDAPAQVWPQPPFKRPAIWPPVEFDYPYKGKLTITRVPAPADIRAICPKAYIGRPLAACAQVLSNSCDIFMLPDDLLMAMNLDPDDVYRHEIGHCNGWLHKKE